MDPSKIKNELVKILQHIQTSTEQECPPLKGSTKPADDLKGFDSKMWPVAAAMLSAVTGIEIPDDTNIFGEDKTCKAYSIDETVGIVMKLATQQTKTLSQDQSDDTEQ